MKYRLLFTLALSLLSSFMAFSQTKISNLQVVEMLTQAEAEPFELGIMFLVTAPEGLSSLQLEVYAPDGSILLSKGYSAEVKEGEVYLSEGEHRFIIFRNEAALAVPLPALGRGQWQHVLVQAHSLSGEAANSLLFKNLNL